MCVGLGYSPGDFGQGRNGQHADCWWQWVWWATVYLGFHWQGQQTSFWDHNCPITFGFSNSSIIFFLICRHLFWSPLTWPCKTGLSLSTWSGCRIKSSHWIQVDMAIMLHDLFRGYIWLGDYNVIWYPLRIYLIGGHMETCFLQAYQETCTIKNSYVCNW